MDKKNEISLDNFKNILIFTLKFTTNQNEIEHLSKLLFNSLLNVFIYLLVIPQNNLN